MRTLGPPVDDGVSQDSDHADGNTSALAVEALTRLAEQDKPFFLGSRLCQTAFAILSHRILGPLRPRETTERDDARISCGIAQDCTHALG